MFCHVLAFISHSATCLATGLVPTVLHAGVLFLMYLSQLLMLRTISFYSIFPTPQWYNAVIYIFFFLFYIFLYSEILFNITIWLLGTPCNQKFCTVCKTERRLLYTTYFDIWHHSQTIKHYNILLHFTALKSHT